ncbi:hypothetical protein BD410DRAFT_314845 [Rickenella mellea]|uniref:Uncharacterized protein n=1 Tax=Rickenella mellea TaxID=50990 RepID=A0A4Y7Q1P7_9AGAM|nr:hypothetical protein BD410DRAFT_314845 [Rickenella mellea]
MSSANLFMEILDRSNASDVLFAHATPATMYRIGRTCWMARRAVQDYSRRAFNINKHLRRFFNDPIGFRSLQAQTGTLMTGVFAHGFLDRTLWDETRLDLYVYPQHAVDVGRWVMENGGKGYQFKPMVDQHCDFDVAVAAWLKWPDPWDWESGDDWDVQMRGMQNFLKFLADEEGSGLTVRMMVAEHAPLITLIAYHWHSTAFMNVITFYAAYSLHPFTTFEEKERNNIRSAALLTIDLEIGYDLIDTPNALKQRLTKPFVFGDRWVDDESSWVLPLGTRGVSWPKLSEKTPPLSFDPFSVNAWDLVPSSSGMPQIGHWEIAREIFKFRYCSTASFYMYMKDTIDTLGELERTERSNHRDWS